MDVQVRNVLMIPVVYESKEALVASRKKLEESLDQFIEEAVEGNYTLSRLDQLAMPGTFYLIYQVSHRPSQSPERVRPVPR